eukprot:TRINITY_DN41174_c0_g1_i1.p1 TRINITY_DN41174_c0_g1~~TRINITY_DN41174_c0_g1_i1.p1  ORF type:complete len:177 (-),score=31.58 TRINITY_DN41174_c0_g1_i1:211-741(-)
MSRFFCGHDALMRASSFLQAEQPLPSVFPSLLPQRRHVFEFDGVVGRYPLNSLPTELSVPSELLQRGIPAKRGNVGLLPLASSFQSTGNAPQNEGELADEEDDILNGPEEDQDIPPIGAKDQWGGPAMQQPATNDGSIVQSSLRGTVAPMALTSLKYRLCVRADKSARRAKFGSFF